MKISSLDTGRFKLDGGAMFGVVPKTLWQKLNPPDENNLCTWAMRCLLIETEDRKILVDTGIGDKQDDKFRRHFEPHGPANLADSLTQAGLDFADITDVFLTHLHFDHVGGAVKRDEKGQLVPTFPKATYWTNQRHYEWAMTPNAREKASFLKENFVPLMDAGVLRFVETEQDEEWLPGIRIRYVFGHTEAMMILFIDTGETTVVYPADLIPTSYHISMPYVMAYDLRPLDTLAEKKRLLAEALDGGYEIFFEHDPHLSRCKLQKNDRGRIVGVPIEQE